MGCLSTRGASLGGGAAAGSLAAMSSTLDPARRAALMGAKLASLVGDAGRQVDGSPSGLGSGAVLRDDAGEVWALLDEPYGRGLGGALGWATRAEFSGVRIVAERDTATIARRVEQLAVAVTVVHLEGRNMVEAIAEPLPVPVPVPAAHEAFAELIEAGGAVPVREHGVLSGEVNGLEVCRVVDDPDSGTPRLAVGIGAHDREMFQMLHAQRSPVESLADVVATIGSHRRDGAAPHPLNLLGASRLLRSRAVADPSLIGFESSAVLVAVGPPLPRANLKDEVPCVAVEAESNTVVVFVSGVDLEVVPYACDAIVQYRGDTCLIVAPGRDIIPVQQRLAALVTVPTRFVAVAS